MQSFSETSLEATALRILRFAVETQREANAIRASALNCETEYPAALLALASSAVDRGVAFAAEWELAKRAARDEGRALRPGEFPHVEEILAHYLKAEEMRRAAA